MRKTLFLLLAMGSLFTCGSDKGSQAETPTSSFEEFLTFYDRFHRDSLYQMTHIQFPLEGLPSNADSTTLARQDFHWQENDWVLMKEFNTEVGFERTFTPLTETLIVEQIVHESGRYGLQRRWAKQGKEWYLIYYADMNMLDFN